MATSRPTRKSCARYTSPIPPAPRGATISYAPSRVPAARCKGRRITPPPGRLLLRQLDAVGDERHFQRRSVFLARQLRAFLFEVIGVGLGQRLHHGHAFGARFHPFRLERDE